MNTVYMDNNATTMVAPEVVDAMLPFLKDNWGNPSSMHSFGGDVSHKIETAKKYIAELLGTASTNEIIITSCGTESDNTAIRSALRANPEKKHIVTTAVEHPAVLGLAKELEKDGYSVTFLPVDTNGMLSITDFEKSLTPETAVVSIMWANNETGMIFPIERIAEICTERIIPLHVDAVQIAGKMPIDMKKVPITYLSISGHKFHAPKGIGALYVRKGTPFHPWLIGGHQEKGRRAGTENVASIIGFGKACQMAIENMDKENKYVADLRDDLERRILKAIPKTHIHGDINHRLPNTSNVGFEGIEGEAILLMLNEYGICASTGSACASGSLDPSHVLMAMGVPFSRAHGSIRFSLSIYNTPEEVDYVLEKLPPVIQRLRELSPIN